jgi:catechol 2,3-dioxygenase-like lactoylglutathione lyase family enzyme
MRQPTLAGIHHVKFPVTDLARSRAWYERVFDLRPVLEFADQEDGLVRGIAYDFPGMPGRFIALRENPAAARGITGFDPVSFAVADRDVAQAWADRLDQLGIPHSPVIDATIGWLLVFHDPDGTEIHLYSMERHGIAPAGRPRTGRFVEATPNPAPAPTDARPSAGTGAA